MYYDTIMAGFGGQGIMLIGNLLAYAAMQEGKNVTYMPAYGVEMRGGTANCTVVVSDVTIGSPIIGYPRSAVVMNRPSLNRFGPQVVDGGILLINSSLVQEEVEERPDLRQAKIPANEMAGDKGNDRMANMVIFGSFMALTGIIQPQSIYDSLPDVLGERYHDLIPVNIDMIKAGMEYVGEKYPSYGEELG